MHARGYFSKTERGLMEWGCLTAVVSPPFLLLPVTTGGPNNRRPTNLSTTLPIREELDKPSKKVLTPGLPPILTSRPLSKSGESDFPVLRHLSAALQSQR